MSIEFAVAHPDLVGGLVLVGAVGVMENKSGLAAIKVPCLVVWGSEDTISPMANCDILMQEIAGARKVIIDGAPHPCYLDQPALWHRQLSSFLKEHFSSGI